METVNKLRRMSCVSGTSCPSHHVTHLYTKLCLMFYILNAEFLFPNTHVEANRPFVLSYNYHVVLYKYYIKVCSDGAQ